MACPGRRREPVTITQTFATAKYGLLSSYVSFWSGSNTFSHTYTNKYVSKYSEYIREYEIDICTCINMLVIKMSDLTGYVSTGTRRKARHARPRTLSPAPYTNTHTQTHCLYLRSHEPFVRFFLYPVSLDRASISESLQITMWHFALMECNEIYMQFFVVIIERSFFSTWKN